MILCQRCLNRNGDDATTCAKCGSALIPEWIGAVRREAPPRHRRNRRFNILPRAIRWRLRVSIETHFPSPQTLRLDM